MKPLLKKLIPLFALVAIVTMVSFFQNCAGSRFGENSLSSNEGLKNCTDPGCTDIPNGNASCTFNGQTVVHGDSVTAFKNSTVPQGEHCVSQTRTCQNGNLTGTFTYASCAPEAPQSCTFNGQTIPHGSTVTAYLDSSPALGSSCQAEVRACNNGSLSGSYQYGNCSPSTPNSCLFNGQTIASGAGVFAFATSSVPAGQTCQPEFRLCFNGVLSGSFNFASCSPQTPASCLFNGQTVVSGDMVVAYQNSSVAAGQSCQAEVRVCNNGALSGSYNFGSCGVDHPASCLFNGLTIPSGANVIAYLTSSVAAGQTCQMQSRSCVNGALSGSYDYATCVVDQPASCLFNGLTISHGQKVSAFETSSVSFGQTCAAEERVCNNGALSGTFTFANCAPEAPQSCPFDGRTLAHGEATIAYEAASTTGGASCKAQVRQCNNGVLSGTYAFGSCETPKRSCWINGNKIVDGASITAYFVGSVPSGQTCTAQSEVRTCSDGTLSGSAMFLTCQVNTANSCLFNGTTVNSGSSVTAYEKRYVPNGQTCVSETRTCADGNLSGSYLFKACRVGPPKNCTFNGQTVNEGSSITTYTAATVPVGQSCDTVKQVRTCDNGVLSGTATILTCTPESPTPTPTPTVTPTPTATPTPTPTATPIPTPTPVNGGWSRWSNWQIISVGPCETRSGGHGRNGGGGWDHSSQRITERRTRTCSSPKPSNGGAACAGATIETRMRTLQSCQYSGSSSSSPRGGNH